MRPVLFELFGKIPIHGYGLMIAIGALLAMWVASRVARRRGLPDAIYDLGMVMLFSGIIGGRLFYYWQFYDERFSGPDSSFLDFFKIWQGGLVFYGGAVGGFLGGLGYLIWKKLPVVDLLDVASVGVPIGMAFGRLGCFLNGCCFGRRCEVDFPLGVHFPQESAADTHHVLLGLKHATAETLPIHPVQLYQSLHDISLFFLLNWLVGGQRVPRGAGMPVLWLLYAIGRFFLEGLRGDNRSTFSGLTISQNVSIGMAVLFGSLLAWLYWRDRARSDVGAAGALA